MQAREKRLLSSTCTHDVLGVVAHPVNSRQEKLRCLSNIPLPNTTHRKARTRMEVGQTSLLSWPVVCRPLVTREAETVADTWCSLMEYPITEVLIPHTHAISGEGSTVPCNYLAPPTASASSPVPAILIVTGLDGYRTELAVWQKGLMDHGLATVIAEIPGTGDSPALRDDPTSPDRQWSSVLDWMNAREEIDNKKIIVWGFSTGGYYTLRLAHTHKDQLLGCISFGGGAHHMFDREWLSHVNKLEYAFDLAGALAFKFGYGNDLEAFMTNAHKFSLVNDGTLDRPCTNVLLVNGTDDEIYPIDDLYLSLEYGMPKVARTVKGRKHMGEPENFFVILAWIWDILGLKTNSADVMKTIPSRCKY
jgi:Esterase FrsA-like